MKRTILIIVILVIAVGGWYGYKLYQQKTPDVVNSKPDVVISASDLLAAFARDTASARSRFVDKIIQVTGNVKRIDTTGSVVLGEEGSASEVTVGLDRRHMKDYLQLKLGGPAVVQGICTGSSNEANSSDPTDLLSSLGTTVELRSAGVKEK